MKLLKINEFMNESNNKTGYHFVNKYYRDETGDAPYGDYEEILNRVNNFCTTKFPQGLKNIPKKVILYRLLNVTDINDINKNKLGKSYVGDKKMFDDLDFLESFLFRYGEEMKKWYIVTIETTKDNIDIEHSMGIVAEYPDEIEFTLKNDHNLKIIDIEEFDNTTFIEKQKY